MYPYPEIARNHIAELHRQAHRADLAIALRRARTREVPAACSPPRPGHPTMMPVAHRVASVLAFRRS